MLLWAAGSLAMLCAISCAAQTRGTTNLKLAETVPLTAKGALGHMIIDRLNDRAFVAAVTQGTVEVVDLKAKHTIASITGPGQPEDFVYYKKCDCVAYSISSGALRILDPNTLKVTAELALPGKASSVALDPQHGLVYVVYGDDAGSRSTHIGFIDLMTGKDAGTVTLPDADLMQLTLEHHGPRGYINDRALHQVRVIDLNERKVVDQWKLDGGGENVAMALDEKGHRLFVGSREPDELLVLDTQTGKTVARLPAVGGVEDMAYDANLKRIYMSGHAGFVDVIQQKDPDAYEIVARVPSNADAGMSKWVPETGRLYVAAPAKKAWESGRLLVYEAME